MYRIFWLYSTLFKFFLYSTVYTVHLNCKFLYFTVCTVCVCTLHSKIKYNTLVPYVSVLYYCVQYNWTVCVCILQCTLHLYLMCLYSTVILILRCTVCVCTLPCAVHMYRMCLYSTVYSTIHQYRMCLYSTLYFTRVQYYLYLWHMSVLYCVQYTCTVCVCTAYIPLA